MTRKEKHDQRGGSKARAVIGKRSREESEEEDDEQLKAYIQLRQSGQERYR